MNNSIVTNVNIYGLEKAIKRSKYPMATDITKLNADLTDTAIKLAQSPSGSAHDNWLCGIVVDMDVTFTVKAWTEAERYHWFEIISSQSTMHRITKFDLDKAFIGYVDHRIVAIMKEKIKGYNENPTPETYLEILYSCPTGIKLTAGISTNYQQLKTIYFQRKEHRLPEWREFCKWIETLPHAELIIGKSS